MSQHYRPDRADRPRPGAAEELLTAHGINIGKSALFPVPTAPGGLFAGTADEQNLIPYNISPALIPCVADFLLRLLGSPRHLVASSREHITAAFVGLPAPPTAQTGAARQGQLTPAGSRGIARLHLAALQQIRRQVLPVGPGNKLPPVRTGQTLSNHCPLGSGCLMLFYARTFLRLFPGGAPGDDADIPSYTLYAPGQGASRGPPQMLEVPYTPAGCVCPYGHSDEDVTMHDALVEELLPELRARYPALAWRLVNDAPVDTPDAALRAAARAGWHTQEAVAAAFARQGPEAEAAVQALLLANLDNVSCRRQLFPTEAESRPRPGGPRAPAGEEVGAPPEDVALRQRLEEELRHWTPGDGELGPVAYLTRLRETISAEIARLPATAPALGAPGSPGSPGAPGSPARELSALTRLRRQVEEELGRSAAAAGNIARMPYLARLNLRLPLGLGPVVPRGPTGPLAAVLRSQRRPEEAPPAPAPAPAPAAAAPTPTPAAAPPPRAVPGMRAPVYNSQMIPRFISDEFLAEHGYDFYRAQGMRPDLRTEYVLDTLAVMFYEHLPNLTPDVAKHLARTLYAQYSGDEFALFDEGHAYLKLAEMVLQLNSV